jgi:hypothetical protein
MKWILPALIAVFCDNAFALPDTLSCHGFDQYGNHVEAFLDRDTGTMKINDHTLYVTAGARGFNNITTENFRNENGVLVYDSVCINHGYMRIYQYDACQNDFIVSAELCCRKHLDS